MCVVLLFFFFFKQKTAYEMRISDWSSDVCSSDLYLMAHDDDALHYREKSLMQGLLNRDDLPRVREMVAETARDILEEAGGGIELVNDYCRIVPVCLVQDYFGLDGVSRSDLIRWSSSEARRVGKECVSTCSSWW